MSPPSHTAYVLRAVLITFQPLVEAQTKAMVELTAWEMMAGTKLSFLYILVLRELLPQFPHTV
jgi:hypothetical protein